MTNPLFLAVEWAHSLVLALGRKADTSISPRVFAVFIGVILLLAAVQAVYRFFAPTQKAQVAPRPGQHGWTKCAPVLPAVLPPEIPSSWLLAPILPGRPGKIILSASSVAEKWRPMTTGHAQAHSKLWF